MEKLSMCRICLVEDLKMYSLISANLREMYERLTDMPFVTKDKKPVQVCYLCRARLQNCHRLQDTCLKSEAIFNKVMVNNELKQMESQDLNTLKTVHPLIRISCVPSTGIEKDDDKIDENNDVKFDPSEITPDAQVKDELYEDDSFINEAVGIKLEVTVKDEDICTEGGDMSDNSYTMPDTQEHDIELKPVEIGLERIDLEQFEIGTFAAKNPEMDLLNGNTECTISIDIPESKVIVLQNKNKKSSLIKHTLRHTGLRSYICNICGKSFTRKGILIRHVKIHTGERSYICNVCGKSFALKCNLVTHKQTHTGERSYKCNVCEKSFSRKFSLVHHLHIHTGEKPYKCIICNKSFSRKCYLVKHRRIHTGERPYSCITCNRSFAEKSNLVKHTRIHTGEKSTCNICGKSFTRKGNLVKHVQTHNRDICENIL